MEGERKLSSSFFEQLKATIIRNVTRKKRAKRHTLREILGPIYFLAIIIILKFFIPVETNPPITTPPGSSQAYNPQTLMGKRLGIYPNTSEIRKFILDLQSSAVNLNFGDIVFFEDEDAMEEEVKRNETSLDMAIIFSDIDIELNYKIRLVSEGRGFSLPDADNMWADGADCRGGQMVFGLQYPGGQTKCPANTYFHSGFLSLQMLVEHTWLKIKNIQHEMPDILIEQLPKDQFTGGQETVLRSIIPLYLAISMSQFLNPMLMVVVLEKEKKIKESLRMVGLRDSVFWLSWFFVYGFLISIISTIGSLLINFLVFDVTKSYWIVVFLLMFEFGLSIIMFAFIMTTLFSKAKSAGISGALSILLISCLYYLQVYLEDSPVWVFWLLGLLSPTAFAMSMDKILTFDLRGIPLSNEAIWDAGDNGIPIGGAMIMIAIDIVLYLFIAAYLDNVIPTEYGTNRPLWFFLMPSYWMDKTPKKSRIGGAGVEISSPDMEPVPQSMQGSEAIVIEDLRKVFKGLNNEPVYAVNGVSLKIYTGEITAILGHNGAGKTTLFNMLTGMTSASSGSAHIFGYDISDHNQMEEIRKFTGICPQHDVLFDELTPREHLKYFGRIRGILESELEAEVESILEDINLTEKGDAITEKLSGGQKRKLSVGIALIGDPKLIFLDEPTAGVDPYSRRALWNVLKKRREGKVILLTTHFMDEADILADRKAIVSKGTVRCYGSSLFLKNRFGIGYHLTVVMKGDEPIDDVKSMVVNKVPGAEMARHYGREISFVLPRDKVQIFASLFKQIEESMVVSVGERGISNYGVSMTTLEEVFLHLGEQEEQAEILKAEPSKKTETIVNKVLQRQTSIGAMSSSPKLNGDSHVNGEVQGYSFESCPTKKSNWQIFKALTWIRIISKFRDPGAVIGAMVLPLVFVSLGVFLSDMGGNAKDQDLSLVVSKDLYSSTYGQTYFGVQSYASNPDFLGNLEGFIGQNMTRLDDDIPYQDILQYISDNKLKGFMSVLNYTGTTAGSGSYSLYNDTAQHSLPLIINTQSNAFAKQYGQGEIHLTSKPFPLKTLPVSFDGGSFGGGMLIGLTYVMIPMGLAMDLIYDREVQARNQLRVNGLSFVMYFGSIFTVLGIMLLVLLCCLLGLVAAFDFKALLLPPAFAIFTSTYFLYTFPALLFTGTISYGFDNLESGQFLFPIGSYLGFIPYIAVFMLDAFQVMDGDLATGLHIAFAFLCPIYIPFGVQYYITKKYTLCSYFQTCDDLTLSDYMDTEIWILYVAIFFHLFLWAFLLKLADFLKSGGKLTNFFKSSVSIDQENIDQIEDEDDDVAAERTTIQQYFDDRTRPSELPVIAVNGLRKVFTTGVSTKGRCGKADQEAKTKVAVRNLALSVKAGEVFGLLGHNGAGKTTTMRIITAEEAASAGRVRIGSKEIVSSQSDAFGDLGYCPQFDAVWKTVTIQEHLEVYAAIRGVPPREIKPLVKRYMEGLRISEHAGKQAQKCSGGTKRKLSYAMAMLGNPKIVLLDEPSTGMDPQSKRFVWNTIQASFLRDRGAVLTTHSMEEADALCSRVGIMVKGELRCLGTTQQLKNKYGAGYMLEVKLRTGQSTDWDQLEKNLKGHFPGMVVNESFSDRRSYNIPQTGFTSLAQAFSDLESVKSDFNLEDYSFSQTTLEQVFIEFAKQQEQEDKDDDDRHEFTNGKSQTTSI